MQVVEHRDAGQGRQEICAITEKGVAHLLSQVSPEASAGRSSFRAVESRGRQVEELVVSARSCQAVFDELRKQVQKDLTQVKPGMPSVPAAANGHGSWKTECWPISGRWTDTHAHEDCPLPEAFRHAAAHAAGLTIGQFHDGLRQLHEQDRVYLHPWTGPLYEMPEPAVRPARRPRGRLLRQPERP